MGGVRWRYISYYKMVHAPERGRALLGTSELVVRATSRNMSHKNDNENRYQENFFTSCLVKCQFLYKPGM